MRSWVWSLLQSAVIQH